MLFFPFPALCCWWDGGSRAQRDDRVPADSKAQSPVLRITRPQPPFPLADFFWRAPPGNSEC